MHQFADRVYKKGIAVKLCLFVAPIAAMGCIFRGIFFQHQFFNNNDVITAFLPYLNYLGHSHNLILQGTLFGFPAYVSTVADWFYPINYILFSALPLIAAYSLLTAINMILAYLFGYLYAKKIGLSFYSAILASCVYIFSSQVMLGAVYVNNTGFYFILPAALYFFELALESKPLRQSLFLVIAGLFLGSCWLSSHVQFVFYIHTFFVAYAIFRIVALGYIKKWLMGIRLFLIPLGVSFLTGLPMIAAVLSFQPETMRAGGVSLAAAVSTGYLPWDVLYYLLPFWNINFLPLHNNLYIGILPFVFLLFVLFSYRTSLFKNIFVPFYLFAFLYCIVAAIDYSPIAFVLHYVPFYNAFRNANEIMFIGQFAAAMLTGLMLEYILYNWNSFDFNKHPAVKFFRIVVLYVLIPATLVASVIKFFFFNRILQSLDNYFLVHIYPHTTQLPQEHYLALIDTYLTQAIGQFTITDFQMFLLLVLCAAVLIMFRCQQRLSAKQFGTIVILLTSLNFALVYYNFYPMVSATEVSSIPQTAEAILSLQKDNPSPYRIFSVLPAAIVFNEEVRCALTDEQHFLLAKEFIFSNTNMLYGIDVAGGYDNYMPALVSNTLGYMGSTDSIGANNIALEKTTLDQKIQQIVGRKNILAAMNVRYIISSLPIQDSDFVEVYNEKVGSCQTPISVYKLNTTWPRYFVTNNIFTSKQKIDNAEAVLAELASTTKPTVILDDPAAFQIPTGLTYSTEVLPEYGSNTIRFSKVECATTCALLVGNTYLPQWSVFVDGEKGNIMRANYLFMAILLTKGTHTVELRYAEPLHY